MTDEDIRESALGFSEAVARGGGYIDESNRSRDLARIRVEKIALAQKARENAVAIGTQIALLEERRDQYNRQADRLFRETST
jgi:hypothetical protein